MKKTSPCPVTKAAEILSDAWTMRIMHELLGGPKRFCILERDLEGISTRTLTNKLRKLEEDGLIDRSEEGYYGATKKGMGLRPVQKAMREYGEKFL